MSMPADYHMHTVLCRHAVGEPCDYARQALEKGLTEIGFSDHSPMRSDGFDDWRMRLDQLDEYVELVRKAQLEHHSLTIRLGLEVDYLPGQDDWVRDLRARHPWDYFIGSVHYVEDMWDIDNPTKISEWRSHDAGVVWEEYFRRLALAAESELFEIIGHADLCKKFCFYPSSDCTALYHRFLDAAAKRSVVIEINTAGLRKDCRDMYPSRGFLELARQHGVPIAFGSDAHAPGEVGMDFREAVALAKSVGYTAYCTFQQRQRTVCPL